MGNADGMSRRGNKSDYYLTPPMCIHALLENHAIDKNARILDPCCGAGIIGSVLRDHGYHNIVEEDILSGNDFLKKNYDDCFDLVISNPPYSLKNQFIKKGLLEAKEVIYILPANVINYNEFQENFLDVPWYKGRYLMRPKFFMADNYNNNLPRRGGISSYAWFIWDTNNGLSGKSWERYISLEKYFN